MTHILLAQAFQVDVGVLVTGLAALGLGALQYLTRAKVEKVDSTIESLQTGVQSLHVAVAKQGQQHEEHNRRISRLEDGK